MSNWFTSLFSSDIPVDGYSQAQREALLDLLVFCMCADRRIEFSEQDLLQDQMVRYGWSSAVTVDQFVKDSRVRADKAHASNEGREAYAGDINVRLATHELRTNAIALSRRMFLVDSEYAKPESASFGIISRAFGWAS